MSNINIINSTFIINVNSLNIDALMSHIDTKIVRGSNLLIIKDNVHFVIVKNRYGVKNILPIAVLPTVIKTFIRLETGDTSKLSEAELILLYTIFPFGNCRSILSNLKTPYIL